MLTRIVSKNDAGVIAASLIAAAINFKTTPYPGDGTVGFEIPDSEKARSFFPPDQSAETLADALKLCPPSVVRITAKYSGSGDSGQFDEIEFYDADGNSVGFPAEKQVGDTIEKAFDQILEDTHGGWEINDGASGEFTITLATGQIDHEHHDYYTESTLTEHTYNLDGEEIGDGDEPEGGE
jgi:hypothetical protein